MNKQEILDIVQTISNSKLSNKETAFADKYINFKTAYPHLYQYACNNKDINLEMLDCMLDKIENIKNNETTQEKASEEIGAKLYDNYIAHLVPDMKKTT